ncbi:MAG: substrate-binding domain-containing protein [Lachnospiraceae bacterium]|uniref:substrate-binding domain-containing protein n=1 Tax=Parablautia sp. Marseille-Q6255 TaxID=3039593 RepID=UPI0024BC8EEC|nr:substrate-binding domain-containing protein [Parablautia sp. Marseille-Q6255]
MKKRLGVLMMTAVMAGSMGMTALAEEVDVKDITLAYVPTTMNNPFWSAMMGGITEKMEELGMDPDSQLVTVDANSDQATMNNYVNDLIAQEVDAIILAPMDCTAVTEALLACEEAGIPVVNVDTAVDAVDKVAAVIASDNYKAGVVCAEDMMSKLEEGSKVAVMNQPSGTACVEREKGFIDTVGDYFEIVSTTDTEGDTAKTMTAAEDVLTADDDLAAFFCINDMGALGCVQACSAAGKEDILIYGVDGNPDFMGYVEDGSATASAAQQPSVIGANAVETAIATLNGEEVEHDQVVDVELITGENIAEFDISDWQ